MSCQLHETIGYTHKLLVSAENGISAESGISAQVAEVSDDMGIEISHDVVTADAASIVQPGRGGKIKMSDCNLPALVADLWLHDWHFLVANRGRD